MMERGYKRRQVFIDKGFQVRFILKFGIIVIASSLLITGLLLFLSRNSTTVAIENTRVVVKTTADFILPLVVQTVLVVSLFSSLAVIVVTLFTSHKISGPLYRLRKEIEALSQGDLKRDFKIRGDDQLQELAAALKQMSGLWRDKYAFLKERCARLRHCLEDAAGQDKEAALEVLTGLEKELEKLKV